MQVDFPQGETIPMQSTLTRQDRVATLLNCLMMVWIYRWKWVISRALQSAWLAWLDLQLFVGMKRVAYGSLLQQMLFSMNLMFPWDRQIKQNGKGIYMLHEAR